jgi:hypothetical protein
MKPYSATASDMSIQSSIEKSLTEFLQDSSCRALKNSSANGPTVGVEQEAFVFRNLDGKPATLIDTQRLFENLSHIKGWRIFSKEDRYSQSIITRVSYEHQNNRYTSAKYEFPPHFIEIAFTYFNNLQDLDEEIHNRWADLEQAAKASGLSVQLTPFISPPDLDLAAQELVDPKLPMLAETRRRFFIDRGESVDLEIVDFPSFMASTQTQVGISNWWENKKFMHRLYAIESIMLPLLNQRPNDVRKRQSFYEKVFQGIELIGFPEFRNWTYENWVSAICNSPLIKVAGNKDISFRTAFEADEKKDFKKILPFVRDLQIIRPKSIGTLEFRADPAVTHVDQIIKVAALRFASALYAHENNTEVPNESKSFLENRSTWVEQIRSFQWSDANILKAKTLYNELIEVLKNRNKGEEKYLTGFEILSGKE